MCETFQAKSETDILSTNQLLKMFLNLLFIHLFFTLCICEKTTIFSKFLSVMRWREVNIYLPMQPPKRAEDYKKVHNSKSTKNYKHKICKRTL